MNPRLASLQPYPFQKLAELTRDVPAVPGKSCIRLSVGEPRHPAPQLVLDAVRAELQGLSNYPTTRGTTALREAIARWARRRFKLGALDPERHVLPACGTREALYSIAQAVVDPGRETAPVVIMPNPFYQIYEGAALLSGAQPYFLNTTRETGYKMDFSLVPADIWSRTQLVYICTPGNPTGAVMGPQELARLIELAEHHDFIIASDECYSEIYFDEASPPPGLLQVAHELGIEDYRRCLVFHSLSKRSNLPGLRSGFIAGDAEILADYLQYRTYEGCTMSSIAQSASIEAWNDETHVRDNRNHYREKFDTALQILDTVLPVSKPDAGFYLWPRTPIDDERFARELLARENVLVLPGSYLSRQAHGGNPGHNHVRMALVASVEECKEAALRIRRFVESI